MTIVHPTPASSLPLYRSRSVIDSKRQRAHTLGIDRRPYPSVVLEDRSRVVNQSRKDSVSRVDHRMAPVDSQPPATITTGRRERVLLALVGAGMAAALFFAGTGEEAPEAIPALPGVVAQP